MFNTRRMHLPDWLLTWSLVILQFTMLGILLFTGPVIPRPTASWVLVIIGSVIILWAIQSIRLGNLSILPFVREGGYMVAKGPYKYIRHPMYTGLIFIAWGLVANEITVLRTICALILTLVLIVKLQIEEEYLKKSFPPYQEYQQRTKRLFPFIY